MPANRFPGWPIRQACRIIAQGGVIAYPTEAVWGLGCAPDANASIKRILELKARPAHLGLILIGASLAQLRPLMGNLDEHALERLKATWPGPVTWIVPAGNNVSPLITGGRSTLAVRVTAHPLASRLCNAAGTPLISTSANVSGRPPARTALAVRWRFGRKLDYLLAGETGGARQPTAIRDLISGRTLRGS